MRFFYSGIQKLKEKYFSFYQSQGQVIMFHQVDNCKENWINDDCAITVDSFSYLIKYLLDNKSFVRIDEIFFNNNVSNKICITFDDGFLDTFVNAYPLLKKYKIPFCIFIVTDYINRSGYMTLNQLKKISMDPLCTIGSHTISHPMLRWESKEKSYNQICKSKYILEKWLGNNVNYFAFPYGSVYACADKDIKNVAKAGYKAAFSTIKSALNKESVKNNLFIPRININEKNYLDIR